MSTELTMLVAASGLLLVIVFVQVMHFILFVGAARAMSNRDTHEFPAELGGFGGRARRAVRNHVEGLAMAAPIILAAAVSGISNEMTVLGAQIFLTGRVAHAVLYLVGVPWVRSAAYAAGMFGLGYFAYGVFLL